MDGYSSHTGNDFVDLHFTLQHLRIANTTSNPDTGTLPSWAKPKHGNGQRNQMASTCKPSSAVQKTHKYFLIEKFLYHVLVPEELLINLHMQEHMYEK